MKQLTLALLMLTASSAASANCPTAEFSPGLVFSKKVSNYDGTCTIVSPRVNVRGVAKFVVGDVDLACEAFGFGKNSGVDTASSFEAPPKETYSFGVQPSPERRSVVTFDSLTCRLPAKAMKP